MILSESISNQRMPVDAFAASRSPAPSPLPQSAAPDRNSCRFQIDRLVEQIDSASLREVAGTVFQDLLRLLECLSFIENHLGQTCDAQETFALFQLIQDEARLLVQFIRTDALNREGLSEELADTFDGITFAITHDLKRVFEGDRGGGDADKMASGVSNKLYRPHGVLTNCLQQSTIRLAITLDPQLIGTRLFNNSDMRYRQSLQLCQGLQELLEIVDGFEKVRGEPAISNLIEAIEKFRSESMEFLMYSDWPQFESFCESIKLSKTDLRQLEPVIHQFRCYLETLWGHVKMRAEMADVLPIPFAGDDNCQADNNQSAFNSFSSVFDLQDDEQICTP